MRATCIILFLFVSVGVFGQKSKLGNVTLEELKEKKHHKDSSASAAILVKEGKTHFEFDREGKVYIITDVDVKIKIYKKEGYKWATHEVAYYVGGNNDESVKFSNAVTYNVENALIVKSKLKSDGQFEEQVNENWKKKKIALPNVKEGSIVEYSYSLKSPYIVSFPTWEFQYEIPVNQIQYQVHMPQYYVYNSLMRGSLIATVKKHDMINNMYNFGETRTTYTMENVPALKDEKFVNNIKNYTSMIEHELSSAQMNDGTTKKYAQSWDDVVKSIYDADGFGRELKASAYFEDEVNALIANAKTNEEKMMLIFNFVKERMNWNEKYGYTCNNGVKRAYKEKVGDVAEINLMLTAMLRHAGLNANPIILSTRQNGIAYFPSRAAFNYVISGVEVSNDIILLDASSKNTMPNVLPTRALNWFGRIIRKNESSAEVSLVPKKVSKQNVIVLASIENDGTLKGKTREQNTEHNAYLFRENYLKMAKESYLEKKEKNCNGMQIDDYSTVNDKELASPMIENYSFVDRNLVEKIGDKIYFSPMLYYTTTENPFTQEERKYPVDFSFPYQDSYALTIAVPEGYAVETLPTPLNLAMQDNFGIFKYNISNTGNSIQVKVTFEINQPSITADYYDALKNFYKSMIEKQNEKVVLRKV